MAEISKVVEKSYNAYLKYRKEWRDKKYGLDRELTLEEYAQAHAEASHKLKSEGKKGGHIARQLASDDRTLSFYESRGMFERLKNAQNYSDVDPVGLAALLKKYPSAKILRAVELTPEEMQTQEEMRRQSWIDRGKVPEFTIQAHARQNLFNELRDIGLSYADADEVMYG